MLIDLQVYLFFTVLSLVLYWGLPGENARGRAWVLIGLSSLLVYQISWVAFLICLEMTMLVMAGLRLGRRAKGGRYRLAAGILIAVTWLVAEFWGRVSTSPVLTLGVSFVVLKSTAVLWDDARKEGKEDYSLTPDPAPQHLLPDFHRRPH